MCVGGSRSNLHIKKALTTFLFSLVLNLFHRSPVVTLKKKTIICHGSSGCGTFSRGGGSNFLQGGPIAFSL